jgi:hypothetical protein
MNRKQWKSYKWSSQVVIILMLTFMLVLALVACNSPTPEQRPGDPFDGSVHWARDIAQPLIDGFAPDAQLYNIMGVQIYSDGRLPVNTGNWSLQAWSPSRQEKIQIVVRYDGSTSTTTSEQTSPPSSNGQPVPAGWVNSTVIFDATAPYRDPHVTVATLVVFNISTYDDPVWGINFSSGSEPNHFVNWDGTYLGTSP